MTDTFRPPTTAAGHPNSNGNGRHPPAPPPRIPPHDLEAEESLLGAMMRAPTAVAAAADAGVDPDDFYKPAHGHIYAAARDLDTAGEPTDPVSLAAHLGRQGLLEDIGGSAYLVHLTSAGMTSSAARYARIVADHATLRRFIGAAGEIADAAYKQPDDVAAYTAETEARIADLAGRGRGTHRLQPIGEHLSGWLDNLERLFEHGDIVGIPTGWTDVDALLAGLQPGQLITVAARPGMGKSDFAGQLAVHVAAARHPVLHASLEMSVTELLGRFVAAASKVDRNHLRTGRLTDNDWARISGGIGTLAELPLYVDDDAGANVAGLRHAIRRITARHAGQPPLVIVDYLQLVPGAGRAENRQVEVSEVARGLKKLAMEMETPVVALAQLNRNVELRADKRPTLADLRESGEIENASDVVAFIYRDDYYRPDSPDRGTAELIVAKQRNGPTDTVRLAYLAQYGIFANLAKAF